MTLPEALDSPGPRIRPIASVLSVPGLAAAPYRFMVVIVPLGSTRLTAETPTPPDRRLRPCGHSAQ